MAMVESAFLERMRQFLAGRPGLTPAPSLIGTAEPTGAGDIPALVLSLEDLVRPANGLGERSRLIAGGVLVWTAEVDLANPVLPEEPSFSLLSPNRRELYLHHGGLVRADGTSGPLTGADISVTVDGAPRPVVQGAPAGDEVQVEPLVGRLLFATPLPASGTVAAQYRLGQWEQRIARLTGVLHIAIYAATSEAVGTLSDGVIEALDAAGSAVAGLHGEGILELSSVGRPDPASAGARARSVRFGFEYELEINRPESSGGIIQRVPVTAIVGS